MQRSRNCPIVVVRDSAIDALCHGASLAGVGVISCMEFGKDQTVAVLSEKKEFVCLGQALVPSGSFRPGETGLVIAPTTVFMAPGTYPRGWTKSDKVFPKRKNQEKNRTDAEETLEIRGDTAAVFREEGGWARFPETGQETRQKT